MTEADPAVGRSGSGRLGQVAAPANSAEQPWPVRSVSMKVAQWIDRLGSIWVEG